MLTLVIESDEALSELWPQARLELLRWSNNRGHKREAIELTVCTDATRFHDVRQFLQSSDFWDPEISDLFGKFVPMVSFMTPDGYFPESFQLAPPNHC